MPSILQKCDTTESAKVGCIVMHDKTMHITSTPRELWGQWYILPITNCTRKNKNILMQNTYYWKV